MGLAAVPGFAYADPVSIATFLVSAAQVAGYITAVQALALTVGIAVLGTVDARRKAKAQAARARAAYNAKLSDRYVTALRALPFRRYVYGRCVTGGDIAAIFTTDKQGVKPNGATYTKADGLKHLVIIFAAHEVETIHEIFIDGEAVGEIGPDGSVTTEGKWKKVVKASRSVTFSGGSTTVAVRAEEILQAYYQPTGDNGPENVTITLSNDNKTFTVVGGDPGWPVTVDYRVDTITPTIRVSKFLGSPTQAVDPYLNGILPSKWTTNHRLRGRAGIVLTLDLEEARFQGGPPNVTADVSGRKVFDPRDSQTRWTQNVALIWRDYMLNTWGYGLDAEDVDDNYVITAANACDELISPDVGGTVTNNQPRYTFNGVIFSDEERETVNADIARTMGGFAIQSAKWLVTAGTWTPPVMDLTDNDLDGQIEIVQAGVGIDQLFNGVRATLIESGSSQPSEAEEYQNATFVAADGEELWEDLAYPYVNNRARAKNLSRIFTERNRQGQVIQYPAKMRAWEVAVGDRVRVTSAEYGFNLKTYRVTDWQFGLQAPVTLTLQEDVATVYDLADATTADEAPNSDLPDPNSVPEVAVTSIQSGTAQLLRLADGTVIPRVRLTWTALTSPYLSDGGGKVRVRWRRSADVNWQIVDTPSDDTGAWILGVREGDGLVFEVRAINSLNREGPVSVYAHLVVGKTAPPSNVADLAAESVVGGMRVYWTPNDEADYLETELRVGVSWAAGAFIWAGPSSEWTWVPPSDATYTIWAVHRDTSGNESTPVNVVHAYVSVGGTNGGNTANVILYQRTNSLTPPANPSVTLTYTFATGALSGGSLGAWSLTIPASSGGRYLWATRAIAYSTTATDSIASGEWQTAQILAQDGSDGEGVYVNDPGFESPAGETPWVLLTGASISSSQAFAGAQSLRSARTGGTTNRTAYNKNFPVVEGTSYRLSAVSKAGASAPDGTFTVRISFRNAADSQLGAIQLTWSPSDTSWVAKSGTGTAPAGTVYGRVETVANLQTTGEWFTDNIAVEPAAVDGAPGLNAATITLFRRSATSPPVPSANVTYTFATGAVSGVNNSWTTPVPAGTDPLWAISASAVGAGATDTIATGEWTTPQVLAQNGDDGATGAAGLSVATVYIYRRTTTSAAPAKLSGSLTYTFATGVLSGTLEGWTQSVPTSGGDYLWVTTATAASQSATDTILTGEWATVALFAQNGAAGQNVATVTIYRRAASAPALPTATATYTFATGAVSGLNNSWTATPPAGSDPLWVALATAASNGTSDTIASNEWTAPQLFVQNGADGASGTNGLNSAPVLIYQRNDTGTVPANPSANAVYTFATGGITGLNNGWSQLIPAESAGRYLYVTTATAASASSTDTIAPAEWATVRVLAKDGVDGAPGGTGPAGSNAATVFIYRRATSAPPLPSANVTYTFNTAGVSGLNNSWTATIPAGTDPLWVAAASAVGTGATDTIAPGEWSAPQILAQNGDDGAAGSNGLNSATVLVYERNNTGVAPSVPSATVTYTFATGVATGLNNGWTQAVPPETEGRYLFVTSATAVSAGASDTIPTGEWAAVRILAQDGAGAYNLVLDSGMSFSGGTLRKTGGTAGWNAGAYSLESYVGSAFVSFQAGQTNLSSMIGLNSDPTANSSYTSLDFAWYMEGDGTADIYEDGNGRFTVGSRAVNDVFSIVADDKFVRYYRNGILAYTSTKSPAGQRLYLDSSFNSINASVTGLAFGPSGSQGQGGVSAQLSQEFFSFPAYSDGVVQSYANGASTLSISVGGADESSNWTYAQAKSSSSIVTTVGGSPNGRTVTITSIPSNIDSGWVDITASRAGYASVTKRFSFGKSKAAEVSAGPVSQNLLLFAGATHFFSPSSYTVTARVEFRADGTIWRYRFASNGGTGSPTNQSVKIGDWYKPTTSNIGASFTIQFGTVTREGATGSVSENEGVLSSTRSLSLSYSGSAGNFGSSALAPYLITRNSDGEQVGGGTVDLNIAREA